MADLARVVQWLVQYSAVYQYRLWSGCGALSITFDHEERLEGNRWEESCFRDRNTVCDIIISSASLPYTAEWSLFTVLSAKKINAQCVRLIKEPLLPMGAIQRAIKVAHDN